VLRALLVATLGSVGCGRLGFAPALIDDATDAPPVPEAICELTRIPIEATPATADLAIAAATEGYAAIWVDATTPRGAQGALLAPNHQLRATRSLPEITDTRLGGITDLGPRFVLSSATGADQAARILDRDLAPAATPTLLAGHVMGHDPFPAAAKQTARAFLSATANALELSYIDRDGTIQLGQGPGFIAEGSITELACADGDSHAHCVWTERLAASGGAVSRCSDADVTFGPLAPEVGAKGVVSSDCRDVRNVSGPAAADSMLVVWTTQAGGVMASYRVSTGDIVRELSPAGSAPKAQFDGLRFWIAWLDGGGALQLSSFALDGTIAHHALAGWSPLGPEAFELVRRGDEVTLALLRAGELDALTICP
jgi:hypothetical protein